MRYRFGYFSERLTYLASSLTLLSAVLAAIGWHSVSDDWPAADTAIVVGVLAGTTAGSIALWHYRHTHWTLVDDCALTVRRGRTTVTAPLAGVDISIPRKHAGFLTFPEPVRVTGNGTTLELPLAHQGDLGTPRKLRQFVEHATACGARCQWH